MWPAKETGSEPRRCSEDQTKKTLTRKMIFTTTLVELPTSWSNLRGDNFKFWENEWYEHGTCSYSKLNQTQYFDLANNIWKGLQLFDIFQKESISPSTTAKQKRVDVENAIAKHIGITYKIEFYCFNNSHELLEIRLCRNHAGNDYTNCVMLDNCGSSFKWKP
ncbi:hypothetical protein KIW84_020742 [Lathyrus oleraceus]|uniref:Uncharacterized protein n=1 Tax=Pisum sativum TaxID=3888 RepID=A0A9D4Y853_PEA|nr:hypothetical protein KIW84_020742 [Pisum sativum]